MTEIKNSDNLLDEISREDSEIENTEKEAEKNDFDLDEQKEVQRKKTLEGQLKSAREKIESGEKTIDDFPEYIQKEISSVSKANKKDIDTSEIIESVFKKVEEKQRLEQESKKIDLLKSKIEDIAYDKELKQELKKQYDFMVSHGAPKVLSLEVALKHVENFDLIRDKSKESSLIVPLKNGKKIDFSKKEEVNYKKLLEDGEAFDLLREKLTGG